MNDQDLGGNRTVFRPSPLAALKPTGSPIVASPAPPIARPAALPPVAAPIPAAPATPRRSGWQTALLAVFVTIGVVAIGYVALQLTGTVSAPAPAVKTGSVDGGSMARRAVT